LGFRAEVRVIPPFFLREYSEERSWRAIDLFPASRARDRLAITKPARIRARFS
jgi:hypothetical protein